MKFERNGVGGLMDRKGNVWGIQSVGSSWTKKLIVLRTNIFCMWLINNFSQVSSIFG